MGREDWYRNKDWNAEIEAAFRAKLKRAREKGQYLRIQACMLAPTHPEIALQLLDEYFELPVEHDRSQAWVDRAKAFWALGEVEQALLAYEAALAREAEFPKSLTQAYLIFPYLVASQSLAAHYGRAVSLLNEHTNRLMFPVDRFMWNAAQALIADAENRKSQSSAYAKAALEAANATSSGFQYHPQIGLVSADHSKVIARLNGLTRE